MGSEAVTITVVRGGTPPRPPFAEFGRFAAARNADPSQHIGYVGEEPDEVIADFQELEGECAFAAARDGARLCGLLGAEWDLDIGRTWLHGPWADTAATMDRLYAALRPIIPAGAAEHELYCTVANAAVVAFARRQGFTRGSENVIMRFPRERLGDLAAVTLPALTPDLREQFADLHDRTFPGTYAPAAVLLERAPPILVAADGGTLLGYVALKLRPEFAEAQIEYVAVRESARGKGIGTRLVTAALRTAFADDRYQVMDLVAGNPGARRVYQKVGFTVLYEMRSFRTG